MSSPEQDQVEAATKHMERLIGAEGMQYMEEEMPEWMQALFDRCVQEPTGVCEHLQRTFNQPMFVYAHERNWRCKECLMPATQAAELRAFFQFMCGLIDPREHCCDLCGRVDLSHVWEPHLVVVGPVLMSFASCDECTERIDKELPFRTIEGEG